MSDHLKEKLLPCPYCNNANEDDMYVYHAANYSIRCLKCGYETRSYKTVEQAALEWNDHTQKLENPKFEFGDMVWVNTKGGWDQIGVVVQVPENKGEPYMVITKENPCKALFRNECDLFGQ